MKLRILFPTLLSLITTFLVIHAAPKSALPSAADVKSAAASTELIPFYHEPVGHLITLDAARVAWGKNTPAGRDEALSVLEILATNCPQNAEVQKAIRNLMPAIARMSVVQNSRALALYRRCIDDAPTQPAEFDAKATVDNGFFKKISKLQQTNFALVGAMHTFICAQAKDYLSGKETKRIIQTISNCDHGTSLPPELATIIGAYAFSTEYLPIDHLLTAIYESEFASLMEQQIKDGANICDQAIKHSYARYELWCHGIEDDKRWPLSQRELTRWELGGFQSEPGIINRAQLVCRVCTPKKEGSDARGVTHLLYVNGDYSRGLSYMEPADHHDYSKAHSADIARLQTQAIHNPSTPDRNNIPNQNTPEFARYVLRCLDLRAKQLTQNRLAELPQALLAFAALWIEFNEVYTRLMAWGMHSKYLDDVRSWPLPHQYSDMQQIMLAQ